MIEIIEVMRIIDTIEPNSGVGISYPFPIIDQPIRHQLIAYDL